jgi:hypothetical protein
MRTCTVSGTFFLASARQGLHIKSFRCWKQGALHYELALACVVLFWGCFCGKHHSAFVAGTMGRPFQSPFAKPPGRGLSSAPVNVVWGFFNAVVAYLLVAHVGAFHPRAASHILAFGIGALLISISSAHHSASSMGATRLRSSHGSRPSCVVPPPRWMLR